PSLANTRDPLRLASATGHHALGLFPADPAAAAGAVVLLADRFFDLSGALLLSRLDRSAALAAESRDELAGALRGHRRERRNAHARRQAQGARERAVRAATSVARHRPDSLADYLAE